MNIDLRLKIFKEKGWSYNPETGDIISHTNRIMNSIDSTGYIRCHLKYEKKNIRVYAHQLAWFLYNNEVPNIIDHIDRNKINNKIINLRNVDYQKNTFNKECRGYIFENGAFKSHITFNYKRIHLGRFKTEEEAKEAYKQAKKIYHKI